MTSPLAGSVVKVTGRLNTGCPLLARTRAIRGAAGDVAVIVWGLLNCRNDVAPVCGGTAANWKMPVLIAASDWRLTALVVRSMRFRFV